MMKQKGLKASLAKWLSVRLRTKWFWVRVQLESLQKGLIDKSNILNRVKSSDLNKKLATLATKPELKVKQDN